MLEIIVVGVRLLWDDVLFDEVIVLVEFLVVC